jgi:hypothetical protein
MPERARVTGCARTKTKRREEKWMAEILSTYKKPSVNGKPVDRTKSHKQAVGILKVRSKACSARELKLNEISQGTDRKPKRLEYKKRT